MKFGVFLPTFAHESSGAADRIATFARRAEELGFDSLWVTDHLLQASRFYAVSWLESITTLAFAAAVTERVRLGTSVVIMPLRQPVILAKQIGTIHYLSDGRFILGAGVGWFEPEYRAVGVLKQERGRRTDEVLSVVRSLLSEPNVSYHGDFYSIDDVTIEPRPAPRPPIWIAGGSQLAHELSPERPTMNQRVLARIVASDGWIARVTCPPDGIASDVQMIKDRLTSDAGFVFAHENFISIDDIRRDQVREVQEPKFRRVLSDERGWDYIEAVYLTGAIDEVLAKIDERRRAGVDYMILHTLDEGTSQLELIAKHVLPAFS